ncbi:hypothetical protein EMMF5_000984 [Cystobasidiomycetes sp. EMM_F5]
MAARAGTGFFSSPAGKEWRNYLLSALALTSGDLYDPPETIETLLSLIRETGRELGSTAGCHHRHHYKG